MQTPVLHHRFNAFTAAVILAGTVCSIADAQVIPTSQKVPGQATQLLNPLPPAYSGTQPMNYVRSWTVTAPTVTESYVTASSRTTDQVQQVTKYFDGLGRPLQTVAEAGSPTGKDVVTMMIYDEFGRETLAYLPYTSNSTNGEFKTNPFAEQAVFLDQYLNTDMIADPGSEKFFYGKTDFEASPLNRAVKTYAPGNNWVGDGTGTTMRYLTNTTADSVCKWNIVFTAGTTPTFGGFYPAGELFETVTTDEHQNKVAEYKDKSGLVVLKKVQVDANPATGHSGWLCTYYVYDNLGNLRFVIPPKAVDLLRSNNWLFSVTALTGMAAELCFRYEYDSLNRMIIKQVPGAGEIWLVYDFRDRLVMTQDAKLRQQGKWLYTDYDSLNRPVLTGIWTHSGSRTTHQNNAANSVTYPTPPSNASTVLTRNYYDNYSWVSGSGSGLSSSLITTFNNNTSYFLAPDNATAPYPQSNTAATSVKGMVTGTMVNVLGSTTNLFAVSFYDKRGRLLQTHSTNLSGGRDTTTTQYSFSGLPLRTLVCHRQGKFTPQHYRVLTKTTYDAYGRVLTISKKINNSPETFISRNQYDELGQLAKKEIGQARNSTNWNMYTSNPVDSLRYSYNVRGWIRGINRDYARNENGATNWFGMELSYDFGFTASLLNGNIAGIRWRNGSDGEQRAYGFTYDAVNRLTKADFTQYTNAAWNTSAGINFSLSGMSYDQNGNIIRMSQYGVKLNTSALIDSLVYGYQNNSNKLSYVTDKVNDTTTLLGDFKENVNNTSTDYTYDVNGNMIADNNKQISAITYNHLNLPEQVTIPGKGTIIYTYDAMGNKLGKATYDDSLETRTITTYAGSFIYQYRLPVNVVIGRNSDAPDTLQFVLMEEGRCRPVRTGSTDTMYYDYFEKDHLGNVRVVLTDERKQDVYPVATLESNTAALSVEKEYYSIDNTLIVDETTATGFTTAAGTNYYNHNGNPPYNNNPDANTAAQSTKLYRLNGSTGAKTGLGITLKVMAGDKIDLWAKSYYYINAGQSPNNNYLISSALTDFIMAFASGGAVAEKGITGTALSSSTATTSGLTSLLNGVSTPSGSVPKAYLNWILFDEQFRPVASNSGFDLVSTVSGTLKNHQKSVTISKSGYLFVYCSNESNINVFFDNLQVIHTRGPLLETTDYYPFGLTMSGISSKALNFGEPKNKEHTFQDQRFDDELGLNWVQFKWRNHDPQIGRFIEIDPLAEKYDYNSTYAFSENKVTSHFELEGLEAVDMNAGYNQVMAYKYGGTQGGKAYQHMQQAGAKGTVFGSTVLASAVAPNVMGPLVASYVFGLPSPGAPSSMVSTATSEVSAVASTARTEATVFESAMAGETNIAVRAKEIHSALPAATQSRTTTAVASATNAEGNAVTLVASSEKNLRPAQRAALQPGEVAVSGKGHAEQTIINHANANGMTVNAVAASRPICAGCATAINNAGAVPASPLKIIPPAVAASTYVKPPVILPVKTN